MKLNHYLYLPLAIALTLSGCVPANLTTIPTQVETQLPSPTFIQLTATLNLSPTATVTLTPPATLKPEQAKETMTTLLQKPVDCQAPCFWGIIPGQTTIGEAINIFTRLGLQIKSTTYQGKDFYGISYDFDSGLSVTTTLTVQNENVTDLRVDIHPEAQKPRNTRQWLAYSPETLIKRYGLPSKVDFIVDRSTHPAYTMYMYFDKADLIIGYSSYDLGPKLQVCPLVNQIDYIRMWLGNDPQNPPPADPTLIPLEEASSLTMDEFSKLLTGDPQKACFNLNEEMFP